MQILIVQIRRYIATSFDRLIQNQFSLTSGSNGNLNNYSRELLIVIESIHIEIGN